MDNMRVYELNLDGLVGPTHNYAGLSFGNIASTSNALSMANPQAAARQGLAKMRLMHQMGLKQAVLPPHQRPNLHLLHQLGFHGTPTQQIHKARQTAPHLLSTVFSASSMWAANTATVTPSIDSSDGRVQFTAANLISHLHRSQEAEFSRDMLKRLFADNAHFQHHPILPGSITTADEGAANHSRLCAQHDKRGVHLFVYGKSALQKTRRSVRFPARQTLEASQAVARAHQLNPKKVVYACQTPEIIDLGVFHNDVIAVANESLLLLHEQAFMDQKKVLHELQKKADFDLQVIEVCEKDLSVQDAIDTYLFNSQLVTRPEGGMVLIAPGECEQQPRTFAFLNALVEDRSNPIARVHYLDLRQSMCNGGGPACLRLRMVLNQREFDAMHPGILITHHLLNTLEEWVIRHYRTRLYADDLADPALIEETLTALDELTGILNLGAVYPFQREKMF